MMADATRSAVAGGLALGIAVLMPAAAWAGQASDPAVAYVERGRQVEARQRAYHERIERLYEALSDAIRQAAPDLLPAIAPPPDAHGYQLLPKIETAAPPPPGGARAQVVRFNWKVTTAWIERDMGTLERLEKTLNTLPRVRGRKLRAYLRLAADYKKAVLRRRRLDSNI